MIQTHYSDRRANPKLESKNSEVTRIENSEVFLWKSKLDSPARHRQRIRDNPVSLIEIDLNLIYHPHHGYKLGRYYMDIKNKKNKNPRSPSSAVGTRASTVYQYKNMTRPKSSSKHSRRFSGTYFKLFANIVLCLVSHRHPHLSAAHLRKPNQLRKGFPAFWKDWFKI